MYVPKCPYIYIAYKKFNGGKVCQIKHVQVEILLRGGEKAD